MGDQSGKNPTDIYLVEQVLKGNHHAFGTIINNTERLVAHIVFKMVENKEDRKDIVQDIYLKAFDKLSGFRFQSRLSTWLAQIAYNTCFNFLQKKKLLLPGDILNEGAAENEVFNPLSAGMADNETELGLIKKELSGLLDTAIASLPVIYKTLIVLYHHEDCSYEELSEITGLPEGTVKSYLYRARKALKEHILTSYKMEDL